MTPDMGATEDLDVTHCASLKTWNSFEALPSTMIALISRRHSLTKECRSTSGTRTTGAELDTTIATCEEAIQIPFFCASCSIGCSTQMLTNGDAGCLLCVFDFFVPLKTSGAGVKTRVVQTG